MLELIEGMSKANNKISKATFELADKSAKSYGVEENWWSNTDWLLFISEQIELNAPQTNKYTRAARELRELGYAQMEAVDEVELLF